MGGYFLWRRDGLAALFEVLDVLLRYPKWAAAARAELVCMRVTPIVYAAIRDNLGRRVRRLEAHLNNAWNRDAWKREGRPMRRRLGKAAVVFMSSHPQAFARGETAHHLLVVDELQDQDAAHLQAVFQPMRATNNATAVYLCTL